MSARDDLQKALKYSVQYAEKDESFTLSSGEKTHWFLNAEVVTFSIPKLVAFAVMETLQRVPMPNVDAVGGPALGATPIAVSLATLYDLRSFTVRMPKDRSAKGSIAGDLRKGDRVVLVEDVVTEGKNLMRACAEVVLHEAMVVAAVCLLYRGAEPRDRLALPGHDHTTEKPSVPFLHLFTPDDLEIHEPRS